MSNKAEQKALLKRCKEIVPVAPVLIRLTRFIDMGFIDAAVFEEIETAIVMNIIQSKEPTIGICSIHPIQKKVFVGAAWIEDGCIRVVFTMANPKKQTSDIATFDREFSGDTIGKVLSRLAFTGGTFISQYQHAFHNVMESIQKKDPLPEKGEKGVTARVVDDGLFYQDHLKSDSSLFVAPKIAGLWEFIRSKSENAPRKNENE